MVSIHYELNSLSFSKLMAVYDESNRENAEILYPDMDRNAAIIQVEQDFYAFLKDVFFTTKDVHYAILEEGGHYRSAVRIEPYQDGVLLTGLETAPEYRGMGYGKTLVTDVLMKLNGPVYSHVSKANDPSLALHKACGFDVVLDYALYLDGSRVETAYTLCFDAVRDEIVIDK